MMDFSLLTIAYVGSIATSERSCHNYYLGKKRSRVNVLRETPRDDKISGKKLELAMEPRIPMKLIYIDLLDLHANADVSARGK